MTLTTKEERELATLRRKWAVMKASKKEMLRCMELQRKAFAKIHALLK